MASEPGSFRLRGTVKKPKGKVRKTTKVHVGRIQDRGPEGRVQVEARLAAGPLETDKDVQQRGGDAPKTSCLVVYDEMKCGVLDKERQSTFFMQCRKRATWRVQCDPQERALRERDDKSPPLVLTGQRSTAPPLYRTLWETRWWRKFP